MIAAKATTIADMINLTALQLEGGAILSPRVEAERIIEDATGLARAELYLNRLRVLEISEIEFIDKAVKSRLTGRPLQYVLGHQQFRHLDLVCREGILIPRSETELLVEEAIKELRCLGGPRTVLDIGCGTGAIALSIAYEHNESDVVAIDISREAVELAKENARLHGLHDRVNVVQSDLFAGVGNLKGRFDVVISNPPYIPAGDLNSLQREVRFEPRLALDGGEDGLKFYRLISEQAPIYLKQGGSLFLEVGFKQAADIVKLLEATKCFEDISSIRDYQGIERILRARKA